MMGVFSLARLKKYLSMLVTTLNLDGLKSFILMDFVRSMTTMTALNVWTIGFLC